jgi:hypothetical protein
VPVATEGRIFTATTLEEGRKEEETEMDIVGNKDKKEKKEKYKAPTHHFAENIFQFFLVILWVPMHHSQNRFHWPIL